MCVYLVLNFQFHKTSNLPDLRIGASLVDEECRCDTRFRKGIQKMANITGSRSISGKPASENTGLGLGFRGIG